MEPANIKVREATPSDVKGVLQLIKELATYEKMPECAQLSEQEWINDGFGDHRFFYAFVAVDDGHSKYSTSDIIWPLRIRVRAINANMMNERQMEFKEYSGGCEGKLVGLALFFYTYSTWEGRAALLEDIFVKPEYRHKGIGHQLLTAVAKTVWAKGCSRLDLHVLDWNASSLQFFKQHGAIDLTEKEGWHFLRYNKNQLDELVKPSK